MKTRKEDLINPGDKFTHKSYSGKVFTADWIPLSKVWRQVGTDDLDCVADIEIHGHDEKGGTYIFYESECEKLK